LRWNPRGAGAPLHLPRGGLHTFNFQYPLNEALWTLCSRNNRSSTAATVSGRFRSCTDRSRTFTPRLRSGNVGECPSHISKSCQPAKAIPLLFRSTRLARTPLLAKTRRQTAAIPTAETINAIQQCCGTDAGISGRECITRTFLLVIRHRRIPGHHRLREDYRSPAPATASQLPPVPPLPQMRCTYLREHPLNDGNLSPPRFSQRRLRRPIEFGCPLVRNTGVRSDRVGWLSDLLTPLRCPADAPLSRKHRDQPLRRTTTNNGLHLIGASFAS